MYHKDPLILGLLMFLVYSNDLLLKVKNSSVALFVDDTTIYSEISTINECMSIQNDLDSVYQLSEMWELKFNATKCKLLTISRSKPPLLVNYKGVMVYFQIMLI